MVKPYDLSKPLVALDHDSTLMAVIEMSGASWLVAALLPGVARRLLQKLRVDEVRLLAAVSPLWAAIRKKNGPTRFGASCAMRMMRQGPGSWRADRIQGCMASRLWLAATVRESSASDTPTAKGSWRTIAVDFESPIQKAPYKGAGAPTPAPLSLKRSVTAPLPPASRGS